MYHVTHVFGPLAGEANDISMAAPRVPMRLFYAPHPEGVGVPMTVAGYMLVGSEHPPETPWPGQVEYVLDVERSRLTQHPVYPEMREGLAVYVLADSAVD